MRNRSVNLCDALVEGWADDRQQPDYQSRGDAWWMLPNPCFDAGAPAQVVEHLLLAARGGVVLDEPSRAERPRRTLKGTCVVWKEPPCATP